MESFKHMLLSMSRVKLLEKVNLHGTTMHGNQGFNGDECFEFVTIMMLIVLMLAKEPHPCLLFLATLNTKLKQCRKRHQKMVQKLFMEQDDN